MDINNKKISNIFERYARKKGDKKKNINIFVELKAKLSNLPIKLSENLKLKDYLFSLFFAIKQCGLEMNGMVSGWESQIKSYGKAAILLTPSGEYADEAIGYTRSKHDIVLLVKLIDNDITLSIFNYKNKMFELPEENKQSEFKVTEKTLAARTHEEQEKKENS